MDRIKLLPDNIANQIAAGEVVQRPASVIKELMENAIDAKATEIKILIKEAGSALIQISDNGIGMSVTDARMCWERHATSKISKADDLFKIKSFGFRGEALASIAAIAHVEMKTKRAEDELGNYIKIEGSKVLEQTQIACHNGTWIAIKNLFYNVPARRNFLKSPPVEMRHIIDEFIRVALPHYQLSFSLYHGDKEVFDLKPETLSKRFEALMSKTYQNDLLQVNEKHDLISISGIVGAPSAAKKTRGEQYLFVNNRFVKDAYLNHAIVNAYDQLISKEQYPLYCLFMEIDPAKIDINIHPTKTEIKFEEDKSIYTLIKSAVKKALGAFTLTPEIDFGFVSKDVSNNFNFTNNNKPTQARTNPQYNPFDNQDKWKQVQVKQWHKLFDQEHDTTSPFQIITSEKQNEVLIQKEEYQFSEPINIKNGFFAAVKNGELIIVDQRAAHERILFEKYCKNSNGAVTIQKLAFPKTIELSKADYILAHQLFDELKSLGYDVADFGNNCLIINGVPKSAEKGKEKELLENFLEHYKNQTENTGLSNKEKLALSQAQSEAVFRTETLNNEQQKQLLHQLFQCENSSFRPNGKPIYMLINNHQINQFFNL